MKYEIRHRTVFFYGKPVDLAAHVLRLTPRLLPWQAVTDCRIETRPAATAETRGVDYFGNGLTFLDVAERHDRFTVELRASVEVALPAPPALDATPPWESVRDGLRDTGEIEGLEAAEFTYDSPLAMPDETSDLYAQSSFRPGRPLLDAVRDLTRRIHDDFVFDSTATVIATPLAEVMEQRRGVCQDFAHVEIAALRAMGLPARYVSGYIRTYRADGGPNLAGTDASHAWVSVFCPGVGWVDFDPTNDLVVKDEHIVLAWGRDYGDVSPIRGVLLGGGEHTLEVAVDVKPTA
jgi:transglutaminase-like putative cysteine protease